MSVMWATSLQVNQSYMVFDGEDGEDDEYLCNACAEADGDNMATDPCFRYLPSPVGSLVAHGCTDASRWTTGAAR